VDFKPADDFPQDDIGYGFDNIGDVLSMPPMLLEKYFRAASRVMDQAVVTGPAPTPVRTYTGEHINGGERRGEVRRLEVEGKLSLPFEVEKSAEYQVRIAAGAVKGSKEPVRMEVRLGDQRLQTFDLNASRDLQAPSELALTLDSGTHELQLMMLPPSEPLKEVNGKKPERRLIVSKIEVIGPKSTEWPPLPESHRRIFFKPHTDANHLEVGREIIERFATRAFRRPVTKLEVERLLEFVKGADVAGDNFETGIRAALTAVLVSPHFLFRGELQPEPDNPRSIHRVNEYALASRLSYFLWSSMPDDELFDLARRGKLRSNLDTQVVRMLRRPKAGALVDNFAAQWLNLRLLDVANPDPKAFPGFDTALRDAMRRETELFVTHIVGHDRSVLEFLDADYTFANERLAKHYGLTGVTGDEYVQVSLKGTPRGGLLTHGSILTLTSNPTRTSPVKRGKYVLENLLGTPPPPPPPGVPQLKDDRKDEKLEGTLRQRMVQHRQDALCNSCHEKMDTIGFGFENFDAVGAWRDRDGESPVDAGGELGGEKFGGPAELKEIFLHARRSEFLRCLSEKLLTYALGRGLEYYDRPAVDAILAGLERGEFKFSALVLGVVHSTPFQKRRGEGDPNQLATR
jgi:hypothetical protein